MISMSTMEALKETKLTEYELGQLADAMHYRICSLLDECKYEDDSVLFAVRDYVNTYEKIADYRIQEI